MRIQTVVLTMGLAGALALNACSKQTQQNAQRTADSASSDLAVDADKAGDKLSTAADKAAASAKDAAADAADKTGQALSAAGQKLDEAGHRADRELHDTSK